MSNSLRVFLCALFIASSINSALSQNSDLLRPRKGHVFEISEYAEKAEDIDPSKAEIIFWRIETKFDEKYFNRHYDSIFLEKFNRELAVVLSCKRLRELHLIIIDEVIHFPDEVRRISELDSLIVLEVWFEDVVINTFGLESILTDEVEEFSYRPMNLSFLRGMSNLEIFATNWNAEVHDPDALLDLHKLKYAQVPVASLQPDFFKNPNLEFVQCGLHLKLAWHKNRKKLKPWFEGEEMIELFFSDPLGLRELEASSMKRKKPIDWKNAFVQVNHLGDTVFQLEGSGKNYSIHYQDNDDLYSSNGVKYELKRNGDTLIARVDSGQERHRTSFTSSNGKDTTMRLSYVRDYTRKERHNRIEFKDQFINGKRSGNYDLFEYDRLLMRRTYVNDTLIDNFPDNYRVVFHSIYNRLKESKVNVSINFRGALLNDNKITQLVWGNYGQKGTDNDHTISVSLRDSIPHGKTYAVDVNGDTVLIINYTQGVQQGRMLRQYYDDRKRIVIEEFFFEDGERIYGTIDDHDYFVRFDHRKGADTSYRRIQKHNNLVISETIYHADTNERENRWFDENTGELTRTRRQVINQND